MKPRAKVVVLEDARADLISSAVEISNSSVATALRFADAFDATVLAIAAYPNSGPLVELAGRRLFGCRSWPLKKFENWRIFYRIVDDQVEIVRLLHAARDLESLG